MKLLLLKEIIIGINQQNNFDLQLNKYQGKESNKIKLKESASQQKC